MSRLTDMIADKLRPTVVILLFAIGAGIAVGLFRYPPTVGTILYLAAVCIMGIIREVRR